MLNLPKYIVLNKKKIEHVALQNQERFYLFIHASLSILEYHILFCF